MDKEAKDLIDKFEKRPFLYRAFNHPGIYEKNGCEKVVLNINGRYEILPGRAKEQNV